MTFSRQILFLFAHQDDEVFVAPRIAFECGRNAHPYIVYFTDGTINRDAESRTVLRRLGVADDRVLFLGTELRIPDGSLVDHLQDCYNWLVDRIGVGAFDEIYVPAWEGGHQDHDALFVIGLAVAKHFSLEKNLWQFYLYNGFKTRGRFFRVFQPLPTSAPRRERKLKISEGAIALRAIFDFKSQKKTWIGLLPQSLINLLFIRMEIFHLATAAQLEKPPHGGALLYERYRRMSFVEFTNKSRAFRAKFIN
jgi:LmbE family N-acetylglucosaminyl deacetylase